MRSRTFRFLLGLLVTCGFFICASLEAGAHGPYTTWYNQRKKAAAEQAGLVGKNVEEVEESLGSADFIYVYSDPTKRTFNYYPYPFLPFAKFQVHCDNGVVTGLELFDD